MPLPILRVRSTRDRYGDPPETPCKPLYLRAVRGSLLATSNNDISLQGGLYRKLLRRSFLPFLLFFPLWALHFYWRKLSRRGGDLASANGPKVAQNSRYTIGRLQSSGLGKARTGSLASFFPVWVPSNSPYPRHPCTLGAYLLDGYKPEKCALGVFVPVPIDP